MFDYKSLYKEYPTIKSVCFDMRLAGYLCNPSANEYTLERLSAEYSVTAPDISGDADDALKSAVLFMAVADKLTSVLK